MKDLGSPENKGCRIWENNECIECSARWHFDDDRICQQVSDNCRTWDNGGKCLTCYRGFIISDENCVVDPNRFVP